MATTIYSPTSSYVSWWFPTLLGTEFERNVEYHYPYPLGPNVPNQWQNKVWDAVAGSWVFWNTDYPDVGGLSYPGPGEWGVDTSLFAVEARVLGRYEKV